jgi:hypothetical protein
MSCCCCSAWLFTNESFWLITALSNLEVEGLARSSATRRNSRSKGFYLPPLGAALRSRAEAAMEDFSAFTWRERTQRRQAHRDRCFRTCARVVVFQLRRLLSSVFSMRKRVKSLSARSVAESTSSSCEEWRGERRPPLGLALPRAHLLEDAVALAHLGSRDGRARWAQVRSTRSRTDAPGCARLSSACRCSAGDAPTARSQSESCSPTPVSPRGRDSTGRTPPCSERAAKLTTQREHQLSQRAAPLPTGWEGCALL